MNSSELDAKKVSELRIIATQLGINGVDAMKKKDIVTAILADAGSKDQEKVSEK